MKSRANKSGLTMVEIMVAAAVLVVLVGIFVGVGRGLKQQSQVSMTKSTLSLLATALEQYYDYSHAYPPDVNYTGTSNTRDISRAFDPNNTAIISSVPTGFAHPTEAESVEVLYYYLNRVPQSRQILNKVSPKMVIAKAVPVNGSNPIWRPMKLTDPNLVLTVNSQDMSLFRVVDAWQVPLEYTQFRPDEDIKSTNFPVIRSAGPDQKFNTADDIKSKEQN